MKMIKAGNIFEVEGNVDWSTDSTAYCNAKFIKLIRVTERIVFFRMVAWSGYNKQPKKVKCMSVHHMNHLLGTGKLLYVPFIQALCAGLVKPK